MIECSTHSLTVSRTLAVFRSRKERTVSATNLPPRYSSQRKGSVGGCGMLAFVLGSVTISLSLCSTGSALEGWSAADVTLTADGVLGATDGPTAMHLNGLTSGFKNDVGFSGNIVSGSVFDALNLVGAALGGGATDVTLEFDLAVDRTSVTSGTFGQLGMFMNSTGDGWREYPTGNFIGGNLLTDFPILTGGQAETDGATIVTTGTNQYHVTVPLGPTLKVSTGTFFQIGFKSNGNWGGTVDFGIDDMRVTGTGVGDTQLYTWVPDPVFTEETLFSWENSFEGWTEVDEGGHVHSLTATGATDGSWALQIDRQSQTSPNFTWGSQYELQSVVAPEDDPADFDEDGDRDGSDFLAWQVGVGTMGTAEHGDGDADADTNVDAVDLAIWESAFGIPVPIDQDIQDDIDDLAVKINAAHSVAFDVRFDDSFPNTPTFTKFGVAIADDSGHWYDAEGASFNGNPAIGTTETVTIPLSSMVDNGTGQTLADAGLAVGTDFIGISISSNTDGAGIYQIDNFRLITAVPPSVVSAQTAVPEPSAWILALIGCVLLPRCGRRSKPKEQLSVHEQKGAQHLFPGEQKDATVLTISKT
jgi:hypothetical protein